MKNRFFLLLCFVFIQKTMAQRTFEARYISVGIPTHEFLFHKNGTLHYESHGDTPPHQQKIGEPERKIVALKDRKPNGTYFIKGDTLTMQIKKGEFGSTHKISIANKEKYIEFGGYKLAGGPIITEKTIKPKRKKRK